MVATRQPGAACNISALSIKLCALAPVWASRRTEKNESSKNAAESIITITITGPALLKGNRKGKAHFLTGKKARLEAIIESAAKPAK
jgi:hypothetical protein